MILYYLIAQSGFNIDGSIFYIVPFSLIITILTTAGLGSLISALNVKYRDFRYIIPFFIQAGLFATPVIYPVTLFDSIPFLKYLLAANPMTGAILLARSPFNNDPIDWVIIGISVLSAIIIFILGIVIFRKTEAYFADIA